MREDKNNQIDLLLNNLRGDRLVVLHEVCAHLGDVIERGAAVVGRRHHLVDVARHGEASAERLSYLCVVRYFLFLIYIFFLLYYIRCSRVAEGD